jgi:nucleotide-binding universal stress UspA family protein
VDIRNILIATDFSADSEAALEYAIELAKRLDAKLHVLHAYFVCIPALVHNEFVLPEGVIAGVRAAAQARLEGLKKRLAEMGVQADVKLSPDDPVSAILDAAKSLPADLIVMGTQGLTGLQHLLLGSVAERTVRLARCPVLTVKADPR